ncbi:uncharacterized protein KQ657_001862 [Scheffersomyces spartinae]|uniref:6-phosphofructo-2-kinase domain-containing protein n=1 Tax=Scheffersomyces spartinae TaxID=45513 RepID=A0A9P8AH52_9ASCO|nr:uncharacterized protein KQ657_001862 [Scheffersomyces spartinae]KAG7192461.1 hypothetical protein KQ657_001862 [Scheffersomyces spartinae]
MSSEISPVTTNTHNTNQASDTPPRTRISRRRAHSISNAVLLHATAVLRQKELQEQQAEAGSAAATSSSITHRDKHQHRYGELTPPKSNETLTNENETLTNDNAHHNARTTPPPTIIKKVQFTTSGNSSDDDFTSHTHTHGGDQLEAYRTFNLKTDSPLTFLSSGSSSGQSTPRMVPRKLLPLTITLSLDQQLLTNPANVSNSNLPMFNKRPLTDTPIVSTVTSPYEGAVDNDGYIYGEEGEEEDDDLDPESTKKDQALPKTKRISHLNLSELNEKFSFTEASKKHIHKPEEVISPSTEDLSLVKTVSEPGEKVKQSSNQAYPSINKSTPDAATPIGKSESISPTTSLESFPEKEAIKSMDSHLKNLLHDIPKKYQEEFEKSPSIEQLKNMLLNKPPPSARKTYTLNIPGQTSSKISPDGKIASVDVGSKMVIVMVGLPARGKSYITNKLTRYLNWLQHDCRVFNVGNTRRKDKNNQGPEANPLPDSTTPNHNSPASSSPNISALSPNDALPPTGKLNGLRMTSTEDARTEAEEEEHHDGETQHSADFFNPNNESSVVLREKWAMDTLDTLLNYVIEGPGSVGIFDATNSTKKRRSRVLKRIQERSNGELKVLFLESICSDPAIIDANIRLKLSGPDYKDMDPEVALNDFVGRLKNYEKAYETIDEEEEKIPGFQYVKMINVGKKVVSYNIKGFLASQTIYFLLNFNLCERQIWITRHGESVDNLYGRIGGDSHLTKRGVNFSKTLVRFMGYQRKEFRRQQLERFSSRLQLRYSKNMFNETDFATLDSIPNEANFCVWTSLLTRAMETGQYFNDQLYSIKLIRMLNELGGGKFEGLTYDEIRSKYPKEFQARLKNKLDYRYPGVGGESYLDVITRLRPLITELERTTDHLLIISHRVVLRVLLAYFLNLDKSAVGELDVPLHTLYCLELKPYGTEYKMYEYDERIDWFVPVEPEHQKNVKEVGVAFKERKYSVIPTAPPSFHSHHKPSTFLRQSSIREGGPSGAGGGGGGGGGQLTIRGSLMSATEKEEDIHSNKFRTNSNKFRANLDKLRKP